MGLSWRILIFLFCLFCMSPAVAQDSPPSEPTAPPPATTEKTESEQAPETSEEPQRSYPYVDFGGQMQFQFDQGSLGSGSSGGGNPVRNGIGRFRVDSQISPRRLRIYAKTYFSEKLSIINENDIDSDDFEPESLELTIFDLYLKYEFLKGHHIRAGQFKVPFGEEFFRTSRKLTIIERADVSRQLFQRDIGVGVFGKEGKFEYGVGVFQGQGLNERERNGTNDISARLLYQVTPGLQIGASGQLGSFRPNRTAADIKVRRAGVEMHYKDGPWKLDGEYIFGDGYNLFSDAATDSQGFLVYSTYRLRPPLDLVIGYDRFDPDLAAQGFGRNENRANDRDRYTFGINYYLNREPVHRFMLNYEIRDELEGPGATTNGIRLRYQYTW